MITILAVESNVKKNSIWLYSIFAQTQQLLLIRFLMVSSEPSNNIKRFKSVDLQRYDTG